MKMFLALHVPQIYVSNYVLVTVEIEKVIPQSITTTTDRI